MLLPVMERRLGLDVLAHPHFPPWSSAILESRLAGVHVKLVELNRKLPNGHMMLKIHFDDSPCFS